jgi:phosphate acyltransferase
MTRASRIAVDAMGGDEGLAVMLAGVARARRRFPGMEFCLVGDETAIRAGLDNHPNLSAASEIVHAPEVVAAEEKPSQALPVPRRRRWESRSIW